VINNPEGLEKALQYTEVPDATHHMTPAVVSKGKQSNESNESKVEQKFKVYTSEPVLLDSHVVPTHSSRLSKQVAYTVFIVPI
jgi:hypothetical protein